MPMYTTSGLVSLTATAPTDALLIWPSVTGAHVSPPSVVFHSPPPTAPKYASFGRPRTPLTAIERPPRSGPIARHLYDFSSALSIAARAARSECASALTSANDTTTTDRVAAHSGKAKRPCPRSIRRSFAFG